ncbi:hypothetical protein HID58_087337, partial [Brassica napus]
SNLMPDMLLNAICAMSLDEKEFLTLPVSRCLGSLIRMKQAFLSMARMIEYKTIAWCMYGRVRGIALSKDSF